MSMLRQEDENSAGPTRSTCGFGGRDSREAPLVATEETPDDDNTASEDMEDYVREAVREVEETERQHRKEREAEMKHLRYGGSDARSVMAQCGSDSGDRSDPEATQGDMQLAKGKERQKLEDDKSQMRHEDDKSQAAKRLGGRDSFGRLLDWAG